MAAANLTSSQFTESKPSFLIFFPHPLVYVFQQHLHTNNMTRAVSLYALVTLNCYALMLNAVHVGSNFLENLHLKALIANRYENHIGSMFKVLLFVAYSIIQDIISMYIRTGPLNGQCKKNKIKMKHNTRIYINIG